MPFEALFLGVGGGFGSTSFNDPYLYAQGVSEISQGGVPVAVGAAGGSTDPGFGSDGRLAPIVQFGGFRHFDGSDWLWGAKFTYGYLDASSSVANLPVPQSGGYENLTDDPSTSFGGNVVVHSYETRITHQISFVPFIGRSYEKMFVYAGAGPTVSRVESNLDGVIGFAEINGQHVDVTGAPSNFFERGMGVRRGGHGRPDLFLHAAMVRRRQLHLRPNGGLQRLVLDPVLQLHRRL
ncbi:hypothetical protein ACFSKM_21865 [Ancylobacter dichloromethanicus]